MTIKVNIEFDEEGFKEYCDAITMYRNAEIVAMAADIESSGYGKQSRKLNGMNVYFLRESEIVTLLRNQIKEMQEYINNKAK